MPETANADLARRGFEHWNERRIEPLLEFFHEDAVWDMRPFGVPDMAAFQGHDGLRRFFTEWLQAFPDSSRYGGVGHWRDGRLDFVENHPDLDRARVAFSGYASAEVPMPVPTGDA